MGKERNRTRSANIGCKAGKILVIENTIGKWAWYDAVPLMRFGRKGLLIDVDDVDDD
jgi:hypothetical protein